MDTDGFTKAITSMYDSVEDFLNKEPSSKSVEIKVSQVVLPVDFFEFIEVQNATIEALLTLIEMTHAMMRDDKDRVSSSSKENLAAIRQMVKITRDFTVKNIGKLEKMKKVAD